MRQSRIVLTDDEVRLSTPADEVEEVIRRREEQQKAMQEDYDRNPPKGPRKQA